MSKRKTRVSIDELHPKLTKEYITSRIKIVNDCWLWTKSVGSAGYGQVGVPPYNAHVVSYALFNGTIEVGKLVRHTCHNKSCCNPRHLKIGTQQDNWNDSEEVHREVHKKRKGKAAHNRKPVLFRGNYYPSKEHARVECKVRYVTVINECLEI